ncbi:MAG: hypothetical protein GQ574_06535 [Crocinitomix sp.]|nr:hypothetical protein [Crocinitomix sp.]
MKNINPLLIILCLLVLTGCEPYKRVSISGSDFYGRNKVIKNIGRYDIYVHQADSVYELVDQEALDSSRIIGVLKPLNKDEISKKTDINSASSIRPGEQDDIHIYVNNGIEVADKKATDQITLEVKNIETVQITTKDRTGTFGVVGTTVLGIILGAVVIFLIFMAVLFLW